MTMVSNAAIDRLLRVAPLGMYFRDVVTRVQVVERISVWAYPVARPKLRTRAIVNASGIFAFPMLGRLIAELEEAFTSGQGWSSLPSPSQLVVEVDGHLAQFGSYSLATQLPMRGLLSLPPGDYAPIDDLGNALPLFSAPSRHSAPELAAIRAELWDPVNDGPAAGAVLEIRLSPSGPLWRGISDDAGRVVAMFVYPPPPTSPAGSTVPPLDRPWTVSIALRYGNATPGSVPRNIEVTLAQPYGDVWADDARTTHLAEAQLKFGEELVLRSRDSAARPLSVLYVTPGATP